MLKKIFAYQRLLLNSISSDGIKMKSRFNIIKYMLIAYIMIFMNITLFFGNTASLNTFFYIALPVISVCFIDILFHKGERNFENVPVKREFIVFNIFLFSIVLTVILYLMLTVLGIGLIWLLIGVMYVFFPSHISSNPPDANQIISTTKANILILMVVVLILFVGTSIVFIKRRRTRICSFALFSAIGYGLLFLLKINMPISNSGKIEFFESFTLMPSANTVLIFTALGTVLICFISAAAGYKLYGNGS
ncbi:MAG: hypothetical protein WCQ54_01315 [Clostridiaceae bacterium]